MKRTVKTTLNEVDCSSLSPRGYNNLTDAFRENLNKRLRDKACKYEDNPKKSLFIYKFYQLFPGWPPTFQRWNALVRFIKNIFSGEKQKNWSFVLCWQTLTAKLLFYVLMSTGLLLGMPCIIGSCMVTGACAETDAIWCGICARDCW